MAASTLIIVMTLSYLHCSSSPYRLFTAAITPYTSYCRHFKFTLKIAFTLGVAHIAIREANCSDLVKEKTGVAEDHTKSKTTQREYDRENDRICKVVSRDTLSKQAMPCHRSNTNGNERENNSTNLFWSRRTFCIKSP